MGILTALDRLLARVLRLFVIFAIALTLVLISLGVIARVFPFFSMSGYDEVIEWLIAWLTFAGAVALWREGSLFRVDMIVFLSSGVLRRMIAVVAQALMLLFAVVFTWKGYEFAADTIETMPFLYVSKIPWYAAMPVCGALMVVYAAAGLVRAILGDLDDPPAPASMETVP
jgi:TRAP-type C4-dicarboxylate transport system permease small subunit